VNHEVAMKVWEYQKKFVELDTMGPDRKGERGNELDQFWSAKFLEDMDVAMPATARKEALRTIDQDNNGKMSCLEYLVWKYNKGVEETVEAPQGDNTEAIKAAQKKLDAVQSQLQDCDAKLQAQKNAKADNEKAIADLKKQEDDLTRAQNELSDAIADLNKQQEDYNNKMATLEKKSQEGTGVAKSKAANELAQLKQEDPLPLRKAKLTQEAALRKVEKQKKETERARGQAEIKGQELQKAIKELEAAYQSLEVKMEEARLELEKIKSKPGGGKGAVWWMQRELFEIDDRLPKAKQKYDHSKSFPNPIG